MTASLCGRNTIQVSPGRILDVDLKSLELRLGKAGVIEMNPYSLRLHLSDSLTFLLFTDGRALILGTDDPVRARRIYAELMGE